MNYVIEVKDLEVTFGQRLTTTAIKNISFEIGESQFVTLVGPSGCGKTTILKCISGLFRSYHGVVKVNGVEVSGPAVSLTLVFQEYNKSLFPWRTVLGNAMLGLENSMPRKEAVARALEMIKLVGLGRFQNHYPSELSGGMQQRVAIARALAPRPQILMMDEPFASLDAQTRAVLEDQLLDLWESLKITVLFVTHDIDEAIYLSQKVIVLSGNPSTVIDTVEIDLPYKRSQLATREHPRFLQFRNRVYSQIQSSIGTSAEST